MKNGIKKNPSAVLFCGGFLILLFLQLFLQMGWGDDVWFAEEMTPLGEYLPFRYKNWTSRLLIEAGLKLLTALPEWIWRILNILIVLLLVWIVADLFGVSELSGSELPGIESNAAKRQAQVCFFVFIWCVPLSCVREAGWIATTLNYLWPMTLGLVAMRPIKHWIKGEKCLAWEYIVYPPCMLFAANSEQCAAILLGAYLLFGAYLLKEKGKLSPFYFLLLGLAAASVAFALTTPGNANRITQETARFFPAFESLNVWQKLLMGFVDTASYYLAAGGVGRHNFVFALLAGILLAGIWQKRAEKHFLRNALAALLPFLFVWGIGAVGKYWMLRKGFHRIIALLCMNRCLPEGGGSFEYFGVAPYSLYEVLLQAGIYMGLLICVVFTIYFLHGKSRETLFELLILGAGLLSRLIIGFSPTIYASGTRTALFCTAAILIVCLRNLQFSLGKGAAAWEKIVLTAYIIGVAGINCVAA